jgi:hypothetical protein
MSEMSLPCLGAAHVHAGEVVVPQVTAGGPRQAHVIPTHMLHNIRKGTQIRKKIKFSAYIRKFRRDRLQSHIQYKFHRFPQEAHGRLTLYPLICCIT